MELILENFEVNFNPATELEEILQNVKTIVTTYKYSVPLDREFGINAKLVDMPSVDVAKIKLGSAIIEAVKKYEPRAKVLQVEFSRNTIEGLLVNKLQIEVSV